MAAPSAKFWKNLSVGISLVVAILVGIIWIGRANMMGTRYKVNATDSVNYSGTATEADAKALGKALEEMQYFTGTKEIDVLLKKSEEGTVVSFVVSSAGWTDPAMEKEFRDVIGEQIAPVLGGKPITIRLLDDHLNTQKEIAVK